MTTIRCLLIVAAAVLLGCRTTTSTKPAGPEPLRVGITPNLPPLIHGKGGEIFGLEADFARALAKELGRPVKFVPRDFEKLIPALQRGEMDIIMSGLSVTAERGARVSFAGPYMETGQLALFHNQDSLKYANHRLVLATRDRVGVESGTTSDFFLQQVMYVAERTPCASIEKAVEALLARKINLVVCDSPVALWMVSRHKGITVLPQLLTREQLAWAVRPDDKTLLDAANKMLAAWKQDGRLKAALQKWAPDHDKLKPALIP
jgi:ABC-type amino acid transport substrate-binding protein